MLIVDPEIEVGLLGAEEKARREMIKTKNAWFYSIIDPNDPFQQTWTDNGLDQGFASIAASIKHQKQYVALIFNSVQILEEPSRSTQDEGPPNYDHVMI